MNEDERKDLAERLWAERQARFKGSKKAAYTAAGVNSATWERAELGESLREHTRVSIVSALWPETGGDWRKIPDITIFVPRDDLDPVLMAHRIDDLERTVHDLQERLEQYEPTDHRTKAERDADAQASDDVVRRLVDEAADLGIAVSAYGDDYGFNYEAAIAARTGKSTGRQLRANQDAVGEENQDA